MVFCRIRSSEAPPQRKTRGTLWHSRLALRTEGLVMRAGLAVCLLVVLASASGMRAVQEPAGRSLDYDFFKTQVQPIFLAKRPGHARCIACHGSGTPLRLQPLPPGSTTWNDEESRKNFEAVRRVVVPGNVPRAGCSCTRSTKRPAAISITTAASTGTRRTTRSGRPLKSVGASGHRRSNGQERTRVRRSTHGHGTARSVGVSLLAHRAGHGFRCRAEQGADHPDQQRRRQRPHHRSGDQQGGRRHRRASK